MDALLAIAEGIAEELRERVPAFYSVVVNREKGRDAVKTNRDLAAMVKRFTAKIGPPGPHIHRIVIASPTRQSLYVLLHEDCVSLHGVRWPLLCFEYDNPSFPDNLYIEVLRLISD